MDTEVASIYWLLLSNATMNINLNISFQISVLFSSGKHPEIELLDRMVVLFLIFKGTFVLFSIVAAPV